ncbi:MFS transporter [Methanolobus sp. ZRKC3]|uniref:MFS transporter n=1 Tax=Methanolobus sp. ZRKC3 TaxID=3125786 RepID=UPI003254018F
MPEDQSTKISIFPIMMVNFIGTLGLSLVLPFLVFLVERFGGNALIYGILASMYPAFQLVGAPLLGKWSDVYGRKKILFFSQAGTLASWLIFMFALLIPVVSVLDVSSNSLGKFTITIPLILLFVARAFDGLTGGNVSVANAYVADITSEEDRSKNFGRMSVSMNLGFIAGPALAGLLSVTIYGELLPVLAAVIISFIGTVLIALFLQESKECIQSFNNKKNNVKKLLAYEFGNCNESGKGPQPKLKDALKLDHIPFMLVVYFLVFLGFNMFYTAFPVHAIDNLKWSVADMGIYFSVLSLMLVVVEGPVLSYVSRFFSDARLAIFGAVVLASNFVLLSYSDFYLTYLAAVLFAIGNGFMWPSMQSILSRLAGREHQGVVQGVSASFTGIASIIGLIGGGFLYEMLGSGTFFVAATMVYLAFILSFRFLSFETKK